MLTTESIAEQILGAGTRAVVAVQNYLVAFADAAWENDDFLAFRESHPDNWEALAGTEEERAARDLVYDIVARVRAET